MVVPALLVRDVTLVDVVAGVAHYGKDGDDDAHGDVPTLLLVLHCFVGVVLQCSAVNDFVNLSNLSISIKFN